MRKKACITGVTGCVGRNLVTVLEKAGDWEITAIHRRSSDLSRLKGCDVRLVEADLYDPDSVLRTLPEGVDALFHVAGNTSH